MLTAENRSSLPFHACKFKAKEILSCNVCHHYPRKRNPVFSTAWRRAERELGEITQAIIVDIRVWTGDKGVIEFSCCEMG